MILSGKIYNIYICKHTSFQQPCNSIIIFYYSTGKNNAENLLQESIWKQ